MITAPGPKLGDQINSRQSILRPGPPSQTARHSAEQRRYAPPLGAARANLQPNFRSGDHASGGRHVPPGKTLPTNPHKPRTRACFTRVLSLEAFRRGPEPTRQRRPISEQGPASETLHMSCRCRVPAKRPQRKLPCRSGFRRKVTVTALCGCWPPCQRAFHAIRSSQSEPQPKKAWRTASGALTMP